MKLLLRKTAQDMERMGIVPWSKLFHTTEEKVDRIVGVHEFIDCSRLTIELSRGKTAQRS